MAGVWEAHDELLDRSVAVKVLAQHLSEDERARKRFEREARAAAGLSSHPNVVTIYDVAEQEGRAFMVMELMRGGSVADVLRRGDAVDTRRALRWLREAAAGLDAAHAAGVVHRDVKPANLLLDERDRLGIGDFGIARLAWEEQVTQTGQVLGTAAYLAPEQAMGEPATAASDRYALSVVAFELLTGQKPFNAEHFAAQARAHVEDDPPRASELNPELSERVDAVIDRGMAKDPDDRWDSAAGFVERLEEAVAPPPRKRPSNGTRPTRSTRLMADADGDGRPPTAAAPPPRTPAPGAPRRTRSGPGPGALVAALAGLLLAAVVAFVLLSGGDHNLGDEPVRLGPGGGQIRRPRRAEEPSQGCQQAGAHRLIVLSHHGEPTVVPTQLLEDGHDLVQLVDVRHHSAQRGNQLVPLPRHLNRKHRTHFGVLQEQVRVEVQRDIVADRRDVGPAALEGGGIHQVRDDPDSTMSGSVELTTAPARSMISVGAPASAMAAARWPATAMKSSWPIPRPACAWASGRPS